MLMQLYPIIYITNKNYEATYKSVYRPTKYACVLQFDFSIYCKWDIVTLTDVDMVVLHTQDSSYHAEASAPLQREL